MNKILKVDYTNNNEGGGTMQTLQKICLALVIIGALNWGLVGLFNFNLVEAILGADSVFTKIVYTFVALSGIINIGLLIMPFEKTADR